MPDTVNARLHWADGRVEAVRNVDSETSEIKRQRSDGSFVAFRADTEEIDAEGFVVFTEQPD